MIDQLANKLFNNIQKGLEELNIQDSLPASQLKTLVESALKKCNVVTREEFDAQQAVLLKTREKLEALEAQLNVLTESTLK